MKTVGIIFSNIHDQYISELTHQRTLGSVPFAGRYRLIDFVLSNMVNSGVNKVGVITKNNYQSLMDHIGNGKAWDLSRRDGGVMLLPPYGAAGNDTLYRTRLEALKGVTQFLLRSVEEYVVMSDCDKVLNIDFGEVKKYHIDTMADITVAYKTLEIDNETASRNVLYELDASGRVMKVAKNPGKGGRVHMCLNIMFLKKQLLLDLMLAAISYGQESFHRDILGQNVAALRIMGYRFDGYFANIDSMKHYYKASMEMLERESRDEVFGIKDRPVFTKIRDSAPARYFTGSKARNSVIADGCEVYGEVSDSILFRDVFVGRNSKVRNSIIMQKGYIGEGVTLDGVVMDKNGIIRDRMSLKGCAELPYFVPKNKLL